MATKKSIEQFFMIEGTEITKEVIISDRFKDDKGKPVKWTIKALTEAENKKLKKKCTIKNVFDGNMYQSLLVVECVVSPDLNNAQLQDFYQVFKPGDVLNKMLFSGEYTILQQAVLDINGFNLSLNDKVDEVKND